MTMDQILGLGLALVFGLWLALALWVLTAPCEACQELLRRPAEPEDGFDWPREEQSA